MDKTLVISAIEEGTVIDHIPCGQAIKIISLLKFTEEEIRVTGGLNLLSSTLGFKDLIKVENRILTEQEIGAVAIFAPQATITFIRDFQIEKKMKPTLPDILENMLICPNERCITRQERIPSFFFVEELKQSAHLRCKYCEKLFAQHEMKIYPL